uniref:GCFC domain-containing protein n=1 Tax=Ascaris lumbricoides TaxID=6252 RepID=A0A0M3HJD8_ASCLU
MLGNEGVAAIFVRSFFPKWYETLCVWLEAPGVVMEEVAMWYNEWKGRFPIEISSLHVVRGLHFFLSPFFNFILDQRTSLYLGSLKIRNDRRSGAVPC